MTLSTPVTVACFGEALWDILPAGIFLGGAPLNTAYHLARQGVASVPISAVGCDFLGDELRRRVVSWNVDARAIARLRRRPTGTVRATLDSQGNASYRIARDVAWDRIPLPVDVVRRRPPAALIFGTLALREAANRTTLRRLLAAWPDALRVVDLNLRPPFGRGAALTFAVAHAGIVKLNDAELVQLAGSPRTPVALEELARRFARQHGIHRLCVTAGARGAGLLWHGTWFWERARAVNVVDTVGAGDAFLSAFLAGLLARHESPAVALGVACRVAEFVASRPGATPAYTCDPRGLPRN